MYECKVCGESKNSESMFISYICEDCWSTRPVYDIVRVIGKEENMNLRVGTLREVLNRERINTLRYEGM